MKRFISVHFLAIDVILQQPKYPLLYSKNTKALLSPFLIHIHGTKHSWRPRMIGDGVKKPHGIKEIKQLCLSARPSRWQQLFTLDKKRTRYQTLLTT